MYRAVCFSKLHAATLIANGALSGSPANFRSCLTIAIRISHISSTFAAANALMILKSENFNAKRKFQFKFSPKQKKLLDLVVFRQIRSQMKPP